MYSYPHKTAYRPVDGRLVQKYLMDMAGRKSGLYLHIPFCRAKCGYCNLFSIATRDQALMAAYADAVKRQIRQLRDLVDFKSMELDSLTLGGGTPVFLPVPILQNLLEDVENLTHIQLEKSRAAIELSPWDTRDEVIDLLKDKGFDRVSIGIQSFDEKELKILGRLYPEEEMRASLQRIAAADFPNVNMDLIYGIPGQSWESLKNSLARVLEYEPEELFLYPLYIRPHTAMAGTRLDENAAMNLYERARSYLLERGYAQESMRRFRLSSWMREGEKALDCGFENMISLGCGGRSYLGDLHVCEPYVVSRDLCMKSLAAFIQKKDFFSSGLSGYMLNEDEHRRRYAVKNILHVRGIELEKYQKRFGAGPEQHFSFLKAFYHKGYLEKISGFLRLTPEGLALSDKIGPAFISKDVARAVSGFYPLQ